VVAANLLVVSGLIC